MTAIRPPTIVCGDKIGVFVGAKLCENYTDLYNIYLNTGDMVPKVNFDVNVWNSDPLSLWCGNAIIRLNKDELGEDVPWGKMYNNFTEKAKLDLEKRYYKKKANSLEEDLMTSTGGSKAFLKAEETADTMGRIQNKMHGSREGSRRQLLPDEEDYNRERY